ncbi:hypothetical protein [Kitasatospora cineracea]|uniref:Uncharacterized protein n=1 Tax=Kitasatospora cineracea TaxID=88074 RepID=A0A3N4RTJ3_9ACTN|nr:hypothetical protein [Kitasatospora cineracea]RPE27334.1 hypothetical protein EDD38_7479 [Kitasatospora cineracea]
MSAPVQPFRQRVLEALRTVLHAAVCQAGASTGLVAIEQTDAVLAVVEPELAALRQQLAEAERRLTRARERVTWAQADRQQLREENAQLHGELHNSRAAHRTASETADRFRDVLADALGHPDENPGDDVLVTELRRHFGRTGPEPTRWRDLVQRADQLRTQAAPST